MLIYIQFSLLECRYSEQVKELDETRREQEKKASNWKSRELEVVHLIREVDSERLAIDKVKLIQSSLSDSEKTISDLHEEINEHKQCIELLNSEKTLLTAKVSSIEVEYRSLQTTNNELTAHIKQLETQGTELESALAQSKADIITSERRLDGKFI